MTREFPLFRFRCFSLPLQVCFCLCSPACLSVSRSLCHIHIASNVRTTCQLSGSRKEFHTVTRATSSTEHSRHVALLLVSVDSHWWRSWKLLGERASPWYQVFDIELVSTSVSLEVQGRFTAILNGMWRCSGQLLCSHAGEGH